MSNGRINHRGGSSSTVSPYSSSYGSKDQRADEVNRTMLEQENDQRWLELGEQVSLLKSVSPDPFGTDSYLLP
jgi:hypothetical protein